MKNARARVHATGFVLIEALVAMTVAAVGLLGIAAFQVGISQNVDTSRQRGEATRLAQEKLEQLRGFSTIEAASTSPGAYSRLLTNGEDRPNSTSSATLPYQTNADYLRSWKIVSADPADTMRIASVTVSWSDRSAMSALGLTKVTLSSIISKTDPAVSGRLAAAQFANGTRTMKGRSADIPVAAKSLAGVNAGRSVIAWNKPTGNVFMVFDNTTGLVTHRCTSEPGNTTNIAATCAASTGYLLSGYIQIASESLTTTPVINFDRQSSGLTIDCTRQQWALDQNSTTPVALTGYVYYACLMIGSPKPLDPWTARVLIGGKTLRNTTTCRYQQVPDVYTSVSAAMRNQNYIVVPDSATGTKKRTALGCPSGTIVQTDRENYLDNLEEANGFFMIG